MTQYVLQESVQKAKGKNCYLKGMAPIGPYCTENIEDAIAFDSEQEAKMHPANFHLLSFFEPVALTKPRKDS